jgi:hypothetical protein
MFMSLNSSTTCWICSSLSWMGLAAGLASMGGVADARGWGVCCLVNARRSLLAGESSGVLSSIGDEREDLAETKSVRHQGSKSSDPMNPPVSWSIAMKMHKPGSLLSEKFVRWMRGRV